MKPKRNEIEIACKYRNLSDKMQSDLRHFERLVTAMMNEMTRAIKARQQGAYDLGFETCQAADHHIERLGKEAGNE